MNPSAPVARSRPVLVVASLAAFMAFLDTTIVNIAFPALQHAFPKDPSSRLSWVLNTYNIIFAALLIPAGQLADRYSRKRLFLLGIAIFTLASGCCAAAPSLGVLIAFRGLQALGSAIVIPSGMALLLPAFPADRQIKAIALLAAVSGVAFAAGPSVGGIVIHTIGWQGIFLINLPIGLLTVLLGLRVLAPELHTAQRSRFPDLLGATLLLLGVGALALAIVQGNPWGWASPRTLTSFLISAILIPAAIWRANRHTAPAIELDLFKARDFTVSNLAIFAFACGLAAKLLCDVLFMTSVWRYSELKTGLAVSASPLVTAAVASTAARLAQRIGGRKAAAAGGLLYAAGCLYYIERMGLHPHYLTDYLPGTALTGIGIALILPTLTSTAMLSVEAHRLAAGAGINSMIRQLGAVLGIALFIAIVGTPTTRNALASFHHGWAFAAIASTTAAIATLLLANTANRLTLRALANRIRPTRTV
jgi:EmrB/QacA subfamily drug resistance transporter